MKPGAYMHPLLNVELGEWTWCLRCERVYRTEQWIRHNWTCPKCVAGAVDAFEWSEKVWPRNQHPEYPAIPSEGDWYARRPASQAH
jgi:hypothetical protein